MGNWILLINVLYNDVVWILSVFIHKLAVTTITSSNIFWQNNKLVLVQ